MKEVTYEDWQKNPTPREMWCWHSSEDHKVKARVIHILSNGTFMYPILSVSDDDSRYETFQHCAEIKKSRRMTNKELSRWLRENPTREVKRCNDSNDSFVYCFHTYLERCADEEIDSSIVVREDDGEWREPLVEVEE